MIRKKAKITLDCTKIKQKMYLRNVPKKNLFACLKITA